MSYAPLTLTIETDDQASPVFARTSAEALLAGWPATSVTKRIVADAILAGLRPDRASDHPRGVHRLIVDAGGRDGLFGCIDIGRVSGKIARAYFCHGNAGVEREHDSVAEVRQVISSWAALQRSR